MPKKEVLYYDKSGNMRDIQYAGGVKDYYDYNEFGQLKKITNSKDRSEFEYDAEGDRIHYKKNVKDNYNDETG